MFIQNVILVFFCLGVISCVFPWFLVAVGPLVLLFAVLHSISRVFIRELKRLDNVTMSPFMSHITSSIHGLATLQAYDRGRDFLHRSGSDRMTCSDVQDVVLTADCVLLFPGTRCCWTRTRPRSTSSAVRCGGWLCAWTSSVWL